MGGLYGVRAYPMGEGLGDRGWFAQAELRYKFDNFTGFLLTDGGFARLNAHPWDVVLKNTSHLRGSGFGARHHQDLGLNWEAVVAWQTADAPVSDRNNRQPRVWAFMNYKF